MRRAPPGRASPAIRRSSWPAAVGSKLPIVEPGTAAARAGLRPGDQVLQVGTLKPRNFTEMARYVSSFRPGTELKLEVRRGSETKTFTIRLGVRPPEAGPPPPRDQLPGLPRDE